MQESETSTHTPLAARPGTRPVEVVVAGHICLDLIPTFLSPMSHFIPGSLIEAGQVILSTGGTVSNTGLALHRLGVATRLIGKVGDDLFGHATLTIVEQHGAGLANHMLVSPESVVITGSSFRAHGRRREAAAAGTAGEVLGNISADGAEP